MIGDMERSVLKDLVEIIHEVKMVINEKLPHEEIEGIICYFIHSLLAELGFSSSEGVAILEAVKFNILAQSFALPVTIRVVNAHNE